MAEEKQSIESQQLAIVFKGLQQPTTMRECHELIVSAIVFLQQLCITDKLFAMIYKDFADTVEKTRTPEQCVKNWQVVNAVLFDHGYEVSEETTFNILAGQLQPAAQLSNDIQRLLDKNFQKHVMLRVGPEVPIRQRVHPFLGQAMINQQQQASHPSKAIIAQPTKLFLVDQSRFAKKRAMCVDAYEKLREKELKAQRLKERKERDAARQGGDNQKLSDGATGADESEQERVIKEQMALYKADPDRMAEKARRTQLLKELELLESAYASDSKKLTKLKQQNMDSPRRVTQADRAYLATQNALQKSHARAGGRLSPVKLRDTTQIPFSATPAAAKKKRQVQQREGARSVEPTTSHSNLERAPSSVQQEI